MLSEWAAGCALLSAAIGMSWALAALLRRQGSLDMTSALYMVISLMGSEMAVMLASGAVLLATVFWLLGAAQHPAGQFALLLHGLTVAGLAWACLRCLDAGRRIDAATGMSTPSGPRKLGAQTQYFFALSAIKKIVTDERFSAPSSVRTMARKALCRKCDSLPYRFAS